MKDDSEIGMEAFQGDVLAPVTKESVDEERLPDSVIINPHFIIQEMPPCTPDPRGRRGAAVRVKVTDNYVEVRKRISGERIRVYFKP